MMLVMDHYTNTLNFNIKYLCFYYFKFQKNVHFFLERYPHGIFAAGGGALVPTHTHTKKKMVLQRNVINMPNTNPQRGASPARPTPLTPPKHPKRRCQHPTPQPAPRMKISEKKLTQLFMQQSIPIPSIVPQIVV